VKLEEISLLPADCGVRRCAVLEGLLLLDLVWRGCASPDSRVILVGLFSLRERESLYKERDGALSSEFCA